MTLPIPSARVVNADGTMTKEWYEHIRQLPVSRSGTWTPTIVSTSTAPTITYDTTRTVGRFNKIADLVSFEFRIQVNTVSSPSAINVNIGLPFECSTENAPANVSRFPVATSLITWNTTSFNYAVGTVIPGTTTANITTLINSTATANSTVVLTNLTNGCLISGTGSYRTSTKT